MSGYLSNIASAASSTCSNTPILTPFVRSRSPIAERDQRLGLSQDYWNFDSAFDNPSASEIESATEPQDSNEARTAEATRVESPDRIHSKPVESPIQSPFPAKPHSNLESAATPPITDPSASADPLPVKSSKDSLFSAGDEKRISKAPPARASRPAPISAAREPTETHPRRAGEDPADNADFSSPSQIASKSHTPIVPQTPDRTPPPVPAGTRHFNITTSPRSDSETIDQTGQSPLENPLDQLYPRITQQRALSSALDSSNSSPTQRDSPRIVIDHLNVEVIQQPNPKAAPSGKSNSPTPTRGPISQIGPLSRISSNLALSLRHR